MSNEFLSKLKQIRQKYSFNQPFQSALKPCNRQQYKNGSHYVQMKKSHSLMKRPNEPKLQKYVQTPSESIQLKRNYEAEPQMNLAAWKSGMSLDTSNYSKNRSYSSYKANQNKQQCRDYANHTTLHKQYRSPSVRQMNHATIEPKNNLDYYGTMRKSFQNNRKTIDFGQNTLNYKQSKQQWTIDNLSRMQNKIQAYLRR